MKNQVNFERTEKDKAIELTEEQGLVDQTQLEKNHKDTMEKLQKDLNLSTLKYKNLKDDNIASEGILRKGYKSSS